ncbi:hypothetical protein SPI_05860 [Niveomyces insectorum RCEF 264]|uniref:Uncharacterized protein n=1 Tax=Niveomyces insectorum RCEF 264 TaxID=1081102 RepID=A0A167SIU0_9HYPO|nr:hypothetical protein SPI_05860 [Niveomyces insectorum RCEF 264]
MTSKLQEATPYWPPTVSGPGLVGGIIGFVSLQTVQVAGQAVKISADVACGHLRHQQGVVAKLPGLSVEFFDQKSGKI